MTKKEKEVVHEMARVIIQQAHYISLLEDMLDKLRALDDRDYEPDAAHIHKVALAYLNGNKENKQPPA